jgi:hypothetical protein
METHMPVCEPTSAYDMPIFEIEQGPTGVCAVTGGYVYRGLRYPEMRGRYFLTDLCAPYIWDLENVSAAWQATRHDNLQGQLSGVVSFGEDVYGELYLAKISNGAIYRLAEDTLVTTVDADLWLPVIAR